VQEAGVMVLNCSGGAINFWSRKMDLWCWIVKEKPKVAVATKYKVPGISWFNI
jgi:hypothetical protein